MWSDRLRRAIYRDAVELGMLHHTLRDADARPADALPGACRAGGDLVVIRHDAPCGPEDGLACTRRGRALPLALLNAMIEIRNDPIADAAGHRGAVTERPSRRRDEAPASFAPAAAGSGARGIGRGRVAAVLRPAAR